MKEETQSAPDSISRGKWHSLVKAAALLGVAVFVFFLAKDPGSPTGDAPFSEIGRWEESEGRGAVEWTDDGKERLFEEGRLIDERSYRVLETVAGRLVLERDYSPEELAAHPEWKGRGRIEYQILGTNRLRREFAAESGVPPMEFERKQP